MIVCQKAGKNARKKFDRIQRVSELQYWNPKGGMMRLGYETVFVVVMDADGIGNKSGSQLEI